MQTYRVEILTIEGWRTMPFFDSVPESLIADRLSILRRTTMLTHRVVSNQTNEISR